MSRSRTERLLLAADALVFAGIVCTGYLHRGTFLGITRGTFDPYDVVSHAASLLVGYGIDMCFQRAVSEHAATASAQTNRRRT